MLKLMQLSMPVIFAAIYSAPVTAAAAIKPDPFSSEVLIQVLSGFLLVIFVILLFAFLIKKINGASFQKNNKIKIVSGLSLGAKEKLLLVQIGEKQMLIGVSQNNIQKIQNFDEPVIKTNIAAKGDDNAFMFFLKKAMKKTG